MSKSVINQMDKNKDKVMYLLKKHPHLRDDDLKLISTIWYHEAGLKETETMTAFEFLQKFSLGSFTHPESIRRVRAKIQEQYADLRGKSYKSRQEESESFKQQITTL